MPDNERTISRALMNPTFIWYLNRYISNTVSWKEIANKCIGQTNDYCLSLIKSKCWTDKTVDGGSWNEKIETLIHERITLAMNHSTLLLKKELGNWDAVILKIDDKDVSPFVVKMLTLIDEFFVELLEYYNINYKFMDAKELSTLNEECLYINHNRVTWHCGPIEFKRTCKMHITSDTPFTPMCDYMTDIDCINAGFMLWEYLLNDEYTFPNCNVLFAEPEHLTDKYIFIDHAKRG